MAKNEKRTLKAGDWHTLSITDKTAEELKAANATIKAIKDRAVAALEASVSVPAGHNLVVSFKFGKLSYAVMPSRASKTGTDDSGIVI